MLFADPLPTFGRFLSRAVSMFAILSCFHTQVTLHVYGNAITAPFLSAINVHKSTAAVKNNVSLKERPLTAAERDGVGHGVDVAGEGGADELVLVLVLLEHLDDLLPLQRLRHVDQAAVTCR